MKSKDIILILVLLIISAMGYMYFTYPGKISKALSYQISASTGVDVEVEKVRVKFFKGVVKVKHINVRNSRQYDARNIFEIAGVYAKFSPMSFFKKEIILDEVVIYSPRVYLERDDSGITNFRGMFAHAAEHAMSAKGKRYFLIRDLEIRNLEVESDKNFGNKAHDVEEIILKNIGAKESGYTYPRLVLEFFDILDRKALAQYGKIKAPNSKVIVPEVVEVVEVEKVEEPVATISVDHEKLIQLKQQESVVNQNVNANSSTVVTGKKSQLGSSSKPSEMIEKQVKDIKDLKEAIGVTESEEVRQQKPVEDVSKREKDKELERYEDFFAAP